jgi:TP901 family phage tail tape measure protein
MADETFESALRLVLQDELTNALVRTQKRSDGIAQDTEKGWRKSFAKMRKGMDDAAKKIQKGQQQIKSGFVTMLKGVAVVSPLALAAKSAAEFSDGMAEVSTLTKSSAAEIEGSLGPIVNATRRAFGQQSQATIKALYDGLSSGVPQTQKAVKDYLDATGAMALGGATDMASAADAITTASNAWKFEGLSFMQIADQMFAGVQEGKTTVTELSASLGQVAATASGARITFSETIGAIAALTAAGNKTPRAMTQITQLISALQKPSGEAARQMKKVGVEITATTLQSKGLAGTLDDITAKVNAHTKSEDERKKILGDIFGPIDSMKAALLLAGDQNQKFKDSTDKARKSTGLMGEAADKMKSGPMFQYKQAIEETKIAWEAFGSVTAPILADLLRDIKPVIKSVTTWVRENRSLVGTLAKVVLGIGGFIAALGAIKVAAGVITVIRGVAGAVQTLSAALYANPIILIITLIVALLATMAVGIHRWTTRTDEMVTQTEINFTVLLLLFTNLKRVALQQFDDIINAWRTLTSEVGGGEFKKSTLAVSATNEQKALSRKLADASVKLQGLERTREAGAAGAGGAGDIITNTIGKIEMPITLQNGGEAEAKKLMQHLDKGLKKAKKQKDREGLS